jgi:hypothetical protein
MMIIRLGGLRGDETAARRRVSSGDRSGEWRHLDLDAGQIVVAISMTAGVQAGRSKAVSNAAAPAERSGIVFQAASRSLGLPFLLVSNSGGQVSPNLEDYHADGVVVTMVGWMALTDRHRTTGTVPEYLPDRLHRS